MHIQITPEPTPHERAAIERALAESRAGQRPMEPMAWWQAGIREAVGENVEATPNSPWARGRAGA